MEENKDPQTQPAPEPAPHAPAAAPAPVSQTRLWLKIVAVLYAVSLPAAFFVISRGEAKRSKEAKWDQVAPLAELASKNVVGVVPVYGVITQGDSGRSWGRGSQQVARKIRNLAAKKEVKAVVLDINSPGGTVGAVQEIYDAILRAKAETKKPFVARFGEISASGGYYIAAPCDLIIAQPGTMTGSIGVIFSLTNIEGLLKKVGVKNEPIKSGKFKDIGSMSREMTSEERRILQGLIDDSYSQFLAAVSKGRKMPEEKLKDLADGRIFTGRQAMEAGLVDKLGGLREALDAAGEMAGIGKDPKVLRDSGEPFENLFSLIDSKTGLGGLMGSAPVFDSPRLEYRWAGF